VVRVLGCLGGGRWEDSAARARPLAAVTTRTKPRRGSNGFSMWSFLS
jgi:hypothetical protein